MSVCELLLGRLVAAEERSQVVLKLLDARRHPHEVAKTYNVLGTVRWKASRYDEAEHYLNSCLALREKAGDRLGMARAYNNLGLLCRSMRRFPIAIEFHQKSMEIRRELGDDEGVARNALNLAWVHFEMENHEHAEELALRAERASVQLGSPRLRAKSLGLLGEIHLARERIADARAVLETAIDLARRIDDVEELFMDLRKMADLELRCGEVDRAESCLKEAERFLHTASPLEEDTGAAVKRGLACTWRRAAALAYENAATPWHG
jgi:tetratricopeptide (TPR) repeat protein